MKQTSKRVADGRTVRIWKDLKVVAKIEKHEMAVWAARFVGEDRILTGMCVSIDALLYQLTEQLVRTRRSTCIPSTSPRADQRSCKSTLVIVRWCEDLACGPTEEAFGAAGTTGRSIQLRPS